MSFLWYRSSDPKRSKSMVCWNCEAQLQRNGQILLLLPISTLPFCYLVASMHQDTSTGLFYPWSLLHRKSHLLHFGGLWEHHPLPRILAHLAICLALTHKSAIRPSYMGHCCKSFGWFLAGPEQSFLATRESLSPGCSCHLLHEARIALTTSKVYLLYLPCPCEDSVHSFSHIHRF